MSITSEVSRKRSKCFLISSRRIASALDLSGMVISTSGSIIGTNPASIMTCATSNCWATTCAIPLGEASLITERILVPKICRSLARFSRSGSPSIGFISCTPSLSISKSPLSTLRKGIMCFSSQR